MSKKTEAGKTPPIVNPLSKLDLENLEQVFTAARVQIVNRDPGNEALLITVVNLRVKVLANLEMLSSLQSVT